MELKEFYQAIGSDFDEIFKRFGNEQLILKFVKSFSELCEGFEEKDIEKAFRAAHTLKGVSVNLGFSELYAASSELTEVLRAKTFDGSSPLFEKVKEQYNKVISGLRSL